MPRLVDRLRGATRPPEPPRPLGEALGDHSEEGVAILTARPWRLIEATVVAMLLLVICALLWSFFGRADVIVSAPGTLSPESDVRRIYAPVDGELVDIYIAEGQPVEKNDVIGRINARGAIEAATNALDAHLKLDDAERDWKAFPEKKALMQRKAEALKAQIDVETHLHETRLSEGTSKLAQSQNAQLDEARGNIDNARHVRDLAKQEQDKYERLVALPGGGGVSQSQVDEKRSATIQADNNLRIAQAKLTELQAQTSHDFAQARAQLEGSAGQLTSLQIEYDATEREIANTEDKLRLQVQTARLAADAAARIRFENIDKDNFLLVLAPASGVITDVTTTQPGDKIQANTPLGGIAPANARPVVKVLIAEQDRAFLHEGLPVKLKFNAFPYQRYGVMDGTLEFISPATKPQAQSKEPAYEGRVRLAHDAFSIAGNNWPLRYGMTATAEIVVRERRLIDFALDPFRQLAG
ncbi:HlyD family efflux transporter periplasmic adaptor subunit [Paraburkholderia acidisoli]|uniref:HlyD family efflux transporter periplasmic adaptor subunit n=1 Tax=Paraburkholderia acidisoli TaxID=2571748 RepID=A0A7Z2GNM5_9BURK|nr:HlyD family efflux transporter periplasmic adaptor subunit [Paraburkholderia acidisoli]QGZ64714.1 HlyD family efflux transporter periplasmic adaptor subunit [Paraburkholderia acidisoli]